jgi:hypothetical protein
MSTLTERARKALAAAREKKLSYQVLVLRGPNGRSLAILGEAHMKMGAAAALGLEVVSSFELRGVETFQRKQVFGGTALGWVISAPRSLLRFVTLGLVRGSTITDAKQLRSGHTVELERAKKMPFGLHVAAVYMTAFFVVSFLASLMMLLPTVLRPLAPVVITAAGLFQLHLAMLVPALLLRRYRWCWVVHPFLGILTLRDHLMVAGTLRMLEDHPHDTSSVVVMGRAHVPGYSRLLIENHGFRVGE